VVLVVQLPLQILVGRRLVLKHLLVVPVEQVVPQQQELPWLAVPVVLVVPSILQTSAGHWAQMHQQLIEHLLVEPVVPLVLLR
jgi:hypothetical protein